MGREWRSLVRGWGTEQNQTTVLDPLLYIIKYIVLSITRSHRKPLHRFIIVYSTTFIECYTHKFPGKIVLLWTPSFCLKM